MNGKMKPELLVGIFALGVMFIFALMTFKITDFSLTKKTGNVYYAHFRNIAGLDEKTRIKIAGVDAGVVEKIELINGRAKLTLRLYPGVVLYADATAGVKATGLLGDKFVEVGSGTIEPPLKDGDTIRNVREVADMDDLIQNLTAISVDMKGFVAELNKEEFKRSLSETVENLRSITYDLKHTMSTNREKIDEIIERVRSVSANLDAAIGESREPFTKTMSNLEDITTRVKADTPQLLEDLRAAAADLRQVLHDNGPRIDNIARKADLAFANVASIANKIDKGEGTIGKLVNDKELYDSFNRAAKGLDKTLGAYEKFKTIITFRGENMPKYSETKGYFNVTLKPAEDKYYVLGVVSNPVGKVDTTITTINGVVTTTEEVKDKFEFLAQFAHRWDDTVLRIGLTENTFGVGADQFFLKDRVILSVDAWDFSEKEYQSKKPHLKANADIFATKNIFLTAGYDNFLNTFRKGAFFGGGIRFEDEDFKTLLPAVVSAP